MNENVGKGAADKIGGAFFNVDVADDASVRLKGAIGMAPR